MLQKIKYGIIGECERKNCDVKTLQGSYIELRSNLKAP